MGRRSTEGLAHLRRPHRRQASPARSSLWILGRLIISGIQRVAERGLQHRKLDATLSRYVHSVIGVTLTILLLLAILSIFGVETTSFAGILAAAGVAIGMAWSGLLSNFAAGIFLMVLRPFKVGDMITAAGITGVVKEIGLFASTIDSADSIRNFVGNAKIFGDTIQNYVTTTRTGASSSRPSSSHSVRSARGDGQAPGAPLPRSPNVMKAPAPSVELLDFNQMGSVLAVRPFCHNNHYWDVYFATNEAIRDEFTKAGYPVAEQHFVVRKPA